MARSSRPRERNVEAALVRYAGERGILTRKFASPARRGVPDRIFVRDGVVLFLEVKRPGEEPTTLQLLELSLLKEHGANAEWCDSTAAGREILDRYFSPLL